jgi:CopG family nickel-responsive transcriptional regulator
MDRIRRFGISMEDALLKQFDALIIKEGYNTRSEAIRDLIREKFAEQKVKNENAVIYGIISFVYDHHKRGIEKTLNNLQHDYYKRIIFTTHVHIDHDSCLEIIIIRDKASIIKDIGNHILSIKGVKNERISLIPNFKI